MRIKKYRKISKMLVRGRFEKFVGWFEVLRTHLDKALKDAHEHDGPVMHFRRAWKQHVEEGGRRDGRAEDPELQLTRN